MLVVVRAVPPRGNPRCCATAAGIGKRCSLHGMVAAVVGTRSLVHQDIAISCEEHLPPPNSRVHGFNGAYSQLLCFLSEFAADMRRTQQEFHQVGCGMKFHPTAGNALVAVGAGATITASSLFKGDEFFGQ